MQTNDQPKRGRPSDYSAEIAEAICDRLVNGESLRAICADQVALRQCGHWMMGTEREHELFLGWFSNGGEGPLWDCLRRLWRKREAAIVMQGGDVA
jgi:hypothetical protein